MGYQNRQRPAPTPSELRELLTYEPDSGRLYWRPRKPSMFHGDDKELSCRKWNSRWAGVEAFTAVRAGRRVGAIYFKNYHAHRVAWAIHTGRWPSEQIDHINGDPTDNRIENLRVVSDGENKHNMPLRADNKSGHHGVYWWPRSRKWRVQISSAGKRRHVGMFETKLEAIAARKKAEREMGFHENHGRAAQGG